MWLDWEHLLAESTVTMCCCPPPAAVGAAWWHGCAGILPCIQMIVDGWAVEASDAILRICFCRSCWVGCRCFQLGITNSIKARAPSVPRSQDRTFLSVLGTTLLCKKPETRNKGTHSHVAKTVCHGNIRERLVGRLLPLLRALFLPSHSPSAK